ncbi:MAG TPA: ATP-binding protein [Polyangiaceae bacterium]|nr:ATP-binding protein [Polyangiaceae bacterium]
MTVAPSVHGVPALGLPVARLDAGAVPLLAAAQPAAVHAASPLPGVGGVGVGALVVALAVALLVAGLARRRARRLEQALEPVARALEESDPKARRGAPGAFANRSGRGAEELAERLEETLAGLRSDRDRFAGVLSGMNEGLLMVDAVGRVALVNPALRELLLLSSDVVGSTPLEVFHHAELQGLLEDAAAGSTSVEGEIAVEGLAPRRLQVRAAPLAPELGGGVFAIFVDVTERRRLETMRRDFVANMSHELRTPVTAIRTAAETLPIVIEHDPPAAANFIRVIDRNAVRLHALVEDLLDLSRIESREVQLVSEALPLAPLVTQLIELFRARAQEREITLQIGVEPSLPPARVDRSAFERVLTNLIDNAIKYAGQRCSVRVSARVAGDFLEVTVADTGAGIPAEHLQRLFERFYRVDAGRSRELGGTGLGLSIVKHLVESMGGTVSVESKVGAGAAFSFTVPRAGSPLSVGAGGPGGEPAGGG